MHTQLKQDKMKPFILNKKWNRNQLITISKTELLKDLISDYMKDPNCRPYDWIMGEKISEIEKASFIYTLVK